MDAELFPRARTEVAPGAVHVPDWLDAGRQRELLQACRAWARPPAGLRTVRTPGGGTMTARQVCLGRHWYPYAYARTVVDGDGAAVKPFPAWLDELGRRAVTEALGAPTDSYSYDIALIDFYDADARMGMHRDSDEKADAPVVSLSLGGTASSASATPRAGPGRTRTSSCAAGTCSCSAGRRGSRTTGCRGCTGAAGRVSWGWPGG